MSTRVVAVLFLVAGTITAPAASAQSQQCPSTLNALSSWYEAGPGFDGVAQVNMVATFSNAAGSDMEFESSDNFQVWSVPDVLDIPITINDEPTGTTVAPGGTFTYDLTLDVSGLPESETTFAFRPTSLTFGTMSPSQAPLESVSFDCGESQVQAKPIPMLDLGTMVLMACLIGVLGFAGLRTQRRTG